MQVKGSKLHHLMHWVCSLQLLIRDASKCTVFFSSLQAAGISNSGHVDQSIALEALQRIENRLQSNELELSELRLQVLPTVIPQLLPALLVEQTYHANLFRDKRHC
jgi:hypothetical protein